MATIERTERLGIRIAPQEVAMLQALSEADGLTASDVVRLLIRRAHAEKFGERKAHRAARAAKGGR
jgi:Ribbon-helix-helix protein